VVLLEVGVIARLLGGDAAGRVEDEHHLEKLKATLVQVTTQRLREATSPLREGGLEVGV